MTNKGRAARLGAVVPIRGQGTRCPPDQNHAGFNDEYVTTEADLSKILCKPEMVYASVRKPPHRYR
jgi:hypothetical protein